MKVMVIPKKKKKVSELLKSASAYNFKKKTVNPNCNSIKVRSQKEGDREGGREEGQRRQG